MQPGDGTLGESQQERQLKGGAYRIDAQVPSRIDTECFTAECFTAESSVKVGLENTADSSARPEHSELTSKLATYIEGANALTMLGPPLATSFYFWLHPGAPWSAWLILSGTLLVMLASMSYHFFLMRTGQVTETAGDSAWLMLDQSTALITGSIWSFALAGDVCFGVACSVFMALSIVHRWRELHHGQNFGSPWQQKCPSRVRSIFTMMWLYLGGSWIGGASSALQILFAACVILSGLSISLFNVCGRYSHVIFHLSLTPYAWFIVSAAGEVDQIRTTTVRTSSLLLFALCVVAWRVGTGLLFDLLDRRVHYRTHTVVAEKTPKQDHDTAGNFAANLAV